MSEWKDGHRTGKLEMFVEVMRTLDFYIYGPYQDANTRRVAHEIRADFESQFVSYSEVEDLR